MPSLNNTVYCRILVVYPCDCVADWENVKLQSRSLSGPKTSFSQIYYHLTIQFALSKVKRIITFLYIHWSSDISFIGYYNAIRKLTRQPRNTWGPANNPPSIVKDSTWKPAISPYIFTFLSHSYTAFHLFTDYLLHKCLCGLK
jgi:hypothetical protein